MSDKEKNEKIHTGKNSYIREILKVESDERVKMIYERYRAGKTIIMDDLKYLLMKNPEAFEKIAKRITQSNGGKNFSFESVDSSSNLYAIESTKEARDESSYINYTAVEGTPVETVVNISNIMSSVRLIIENMSAEELKEISKNVYEPLELLKRIAVLKELEDKSIDEKVLYTYAKEKDFDISV